MAALTCRVVSSLVNASAQRGLLGKKSIKLRKQVTRYLQGTQAHASSYSMTFARLFLRFEATSAHRNEDAAWAAAKSLCVTV